jgi:hypothetical protein
VISRALALVACAGCAAAVRPPASRPTDLGAELRAVDGLIAGGRFDEADARLAGDRAAFDGDEAAQDELADKQATVRAWRRDYRGAAAIVEARIAAAARRRDPTAEYQLWNLQTWVRWGGGDLDGAIAANENLRRIAGGLAAEDAVEPLAHYWWDRAYLHVDRAYRLAGPERARVLAIAEDARRHYVEDIAPRLGPDQGTDPVHVLDCYIAERAGDVARAVREADQVRETWPDLQDAYILLTAYRLAGDTARVDALKARIQRGSYIMVPIYLQQMERDMRVTVGGDR